jgi:hypothetical protein
MQTYQLVNHTGTNTTVMITIHRHFDHHAITPTGAEMGAVFRCISPRGVGGNELYFAILKPEPIMYSGAQAINRAPARYRPSMKSDTVPIAGAAQQCKTHQNYPPPPGLGVCTMYESSGLA